MQRNHTLLGFFDWLDGCLKDYKVEVTRFSYQRQTVIVSALSAQLAEDVGASKAADMDFSRCASMTERYEACAQAVSVS